MIELEERLRTYAASVLAEAPPVTVEEVRRGRPQARSVLRRGLAVAAVVLALVGVGAAVTIDDEEETTRVTTNPQTFPLTLDGHRDWTIAVLNGDIEPSDEAMEARYTDDFLAAISPKEFRAVSAQLTPMAPWEALTEVERRDEEVLAVQLASASGEQVRLTLHRTPSGKLDGSTVLAAAPCADPVPADTKLDGPLGDAHAWVTELLASSSSPTDEELRQRFAPSFLAEVTPDRLRAGLPQLRALGPYTLRSFEGPPLPFSLTARVGLRSGEEARLALAVETDPPHRITGFSVFTQAPCRLTPNG